MPVGSGGGVNSVGVTGVKSNTIHYCFDSRKFEITTLGVHKMMFVMEFWV